jgi:hypothetical protein
MCDVSYCVSFVNVRVFVCFQFRIVVANLFFGDPWPSVEARVCLRVCTTSSASSAASSSTASAVSAADADTAAMTAASYARRFLASDIPSMETCICQYATFYYVVVNAQLYWWLYVYWRAHIFLC